MLVFLGVLASTTAIHAEELVAATYPDLYPLYGRDQEGRPDGFAIDLMKELAARDHTHVSFNSYPTWAGVVNALSEREVDVAPMLVVTPERERRVLFTRPFETWHVLLFVRREESGLEDLNDLAGLKVGVTANSVVEETLRRLQPQANLVTFPAIGASLFALISGEVSAVAVGEPAMWHVARQAQLTDRIKTIGAPVVELSMALAVRPDRPQLRDRLNDQLIAFINTPEYQRLYAKWHSSPPPTWTGKRVAWTIGLALGALLIVIVGGLGLHRRRAKRRLDESVRRLSGVLDNIPDLAWLRDCNGRIIAVNDAFATACGRPVAEIIGKTHLDAWPAGPVHGGKDAAEVVRTRQARRTEERVVDADGNERWIETIKSPIFDVAKQVIGTTAIARDITERKRMVEALRASEERLSLALLFAGSGSWDYDVQSQQLHWSEGQFHNFGYPVQPDGLASLGMWRARVHPDDVDRVWTAFRTAIANHTLYAACYRIVHPDDGRIAWIDAKARMFFDSDGTLLRVLGVSHDITERKLTEDRLRESEERYTLALLFSGVGSWDWDVRTNQAIWSENHYRLLGYTPALDCTANVAMWLDRVHPDDKEQALRELEDARVHHTVYLNCHRIIRADTGEIVWVELRGRFFYDSAGNAVRMLGIIRDVTARKQAESALVASEAQLRRFIEASPVAIAMFDREMRYLAVSRRFITDYKLERDDVVGLSHYDVFPEIPPHWREIHRRCLQGAVERSEGERFVRADGSCNWTRWEIQPWREPNGTIGGIVLFTEDISARREAEEALFREKELALTTLHSIGDAVITTDAERRIDYLNPVAERLTGWSCGEARGRPLSEVCRIVDEETSEPVVDPIAACLCEGRTLQLNDKILIDRSGQKRAIEDSASPIRQSDGQILGAVLVFHDVSDKKRMAKQLQYDAAHDALTGLINRREFERRLDRALESARRHGIDHALCYFDLDQFKVVNDAAGHAAGDTLLQRVRSLLIGKFRDRDTLARLGGDEFALLLESCGIAEAVRIAESVVNTFRDWRFVWEGRVFQVGASAGVVPITAQSLSSADILSKADVACYTAKERGRGRIHLYRDSVAGRSKHHAELLVAATLTDALEQQRFRLFAQPIVALSADEPVVSRHEVLIRLLDADGRLIEPGGFVPAAERYGLMPAIDRWVIAAAFSAYEGSVAAAEGSEISVNLSGASLNSEELLTFVLTQFDRYQVPPARICFEITETAAIHHLEHATQFVNEVRRRGSRIALDDFGGGVSSFLYLRMLPADYLKIDGSFVETMADNAADEAVVSAINDVGHKMGFATIAECAVSDAIVDRLRRMGVDYAQGEALGMPRPLEVALAGDKVVSVSERTRPGESGRRRWTSTS